MRHAPVAGEFGTGASVFQDRGAAGQPGASTGSGAAIVARSHRHRRVLHRGSRRRSPLGPHGRLPGSAVPPACWPRREVGRPPGTSGSEHRSAGTSPGRRRPSWRSGPPGTDRFCPSTRSNSSRSTSRPSTSEIILEERLPHLRRHDEVRGDIRMVIRPLDPEAKRQLVEREAGAPHGSLELALVEGRGVGNDHVRRDASSAVHDAAAFRMEDLTSDRVSDDSAHGRHLGRDRERQVVGACRASRCARSTCRSACTSRPS